LALLEAVYRRGPQYLPDVLVDHPDGILGSAPEPTVSDLMNLSRSAERYFRPLIEMVASGRVPYRPNPVFAGSGDVGGADADMILGDALIELKVTKTLSAAAIRKALVQLVGYSLLDYQDQFEIRRLGVYFTRQEFMRIWPLWSLMFPLAYVVRSETEPDEAAIRQRLARLRDLMHRAAGGHEIDHERELGE
jgi:hypothetical protein